MGRKGVSKHKPTQTKSKPWPNKDVSNSISSLVQATERQSVKSHDTGKVVLSTGDGGKPLSDGKKQHRKG